MTEPEIISVSDLTVRVERQVILENISFSLGRGRFLAVTGKSGSGKSTLLHALAGFIKHDGSILRPPRIGVVFQHYAVFPWLTVEQNIAFGLKGDDAKNKRRVVEHYLEIMDLAAAGKKYPAQLSGGQLQRVAIARAIAPEPDLVLMDEPFGSLDLYTRESLQLWLLSIWRERQTTIVFVTHDIEEAIFLADEILILGQGSIQASFAIDFPRPRNKEARFDSQFVELRRKIIETTESSANG